MNKTLYRVAYRTASNVGFMEPAAEEAVRSHVLRMRAKHDGVEWAAQCSRDGGFSWQRFGVTVAETDALRLANLVAALQGFPVQEHTGQAFHVPSEVFAALHAEGGVA